MYCELFKLDEPPFRLNPDPQFLFESKQHARAKAYMESSIWLADGFVVLTGEIGCGKTTLIESFIESLPEDVILAHISQTQLTPVELLQALLVEFGFSPFRMKKMELLSVLKEFLLEQYENGRRVLVILDEAQNLKRKVLEEIRLLSGIETQKERVLRIILAGQPELGDTLDAASLDQLRQRVRLRFHISALTKRETVEYIKHRLKVAGAGKRKIFDDEALRLIFRYSGGVPRLINLLCDSAMLCAFADDTTSINAELLMDAVEELQWLPYEERVREREIAIDQTDEQDISNHPMATLKIEADNKEIDSIELVAGRTVIGRAAGCELTLKSNVISRYHAQIVTDLQQSLLEDLNSTNGIYVGSERVRSHKLSDGDVISIGQHKIIYQNLRAAYASTEDDDDSDDETSRNAKKS
jgi:general secretion pathway protein A